MGKLYLFLPYGLFKLITPALYGFLIVIIYRLIYFCELNKCYENDCMMLIFWRDSLQGTARVPWFSVAKSVPVYALAVAHFTNNLGFYTLLTCLPQYFKYILHFDIKSVRLFVHILVFALCLQCFDTVGWASGRASGLQKTLSDELLLWLSVSSEVQIVCIWSS